MIIDNNLFRPLGWTPPLPREPYRAPPKAIIESSAGNQTHIVSLGDKLDAETEIVEIQPKQVTLLSNGQQRLLFLNTARWIK